MSADVKLEGLRELRMKLTAFEKESIKAAMEGLQNAGLDIIEDAKNNLRANGSIAGGNLRASGKVQKVKGDNSSLDVGFFSKGSSNGYAYFVERGRRPGGVPPVSSLKQWLKKKRSGLKNSAVRSAQVWARRFGLDMNKLLEREAFGLAMAIAKKGTKPHPFFEPAVDKNENKIEKAVSQAVKKKL